MRSIDAIVYDLEIVRAVPSPIEPNLPGIEYCQGWDDKSGMGISVLCALDMMTGQPHIFLADNLSEFAVLAKTREHLIGFNSLSFDDAVLEAAGISVRTTFDLKRAIGGIVGGQRKKGYRLADIARENLGEEKSMDGALAPVEWQRGQYGRVISYCMKDVHITARLISMLPFILDPVTKQPIAIPIPWEISSQLELVDDGK